MGHADKKARVVWKIALRKPSGVFFVRGMFKLIGKRAGAKRAARKIPLALSA